MTVRTINGKVRVAGPQAGTPRQLQPKYGLTFNGTSEYVTGPLFNPSLLSQMSVSVWFKTSDSGATQEIVGQWGYVTQASWFLGLGSSGNVYAYACSDGSGSTNYIGYNTAGTYNDGEWHHAALVLSGTSLKLYVDGVDQGAVNDSNGTFTGLHAATDPIRIGVNAKVSNVRYFAGSLDDIRIYNTALSKSEIKSIADKKSLIRTLNSDNSNAPLIHYKCEDPVTSPIVRNSGSLGSAADATITGTIANVRGTVSPVFCWANEVGGNHAWTSDGVDDYLNTQLTLNGATAFTVWRRCRYLSTNLYDLDGFLNTGADAIRLGRDTGDTSLFYETGLTGEVSTPTTTVADGRVNTISVSSSVGGNYEARADNVVVASGASSMIALTNGLNFTIGVANQTSGLAHFGHAEYYEYLIADRVLTDEELTWLETGGASGTAIDFANDPNILLYTDFQEQTDTQITNLANPNLPILKAVGGEMTMVPRSEVDTTKDVDQAGYSYRSAFAVTAPNTNGYLDFGQQLIPSTGDFDFSFDFNLFSFDSGDAFQTLLGQWAVGEEGRLLVVANKGTGQCQLAINGTTTINISGTTSAITLGKWHTARVTRQGTVISFYFDGTLVGTGVKADAFYAGDTHLGQSTVLTTHDEFHGLISNIDFGSGQQYLTAANQTISGATLTNASYVNVVRGKPGNDLQYVGQCPRDMVLTSPAVVGNGTSEYVYVPGFSSANIQVDELDLTFYVSSADTTAGQAIVAFGNDADNNATLKLEKATTTAGKIRVFMKASNAATILSVESSATVFDGIPHKVRLTLDGLGGYALYVDNALDSSGTYTPANTTAVDTLTYLAWTRNALAVVTHAAATIWDVDLIHEGTQFCTHPLTEPYGDIAFDISGNGNDGKLTGTIANMRAGTQNKSDVLVKSGYSVGRWYDGTNDSWSRATLVGGATRFCVSGWLVTDALGSTQVIVGEYKAVGSNDRSFLVVIEPDGKLRWTQSANGLTIAKYATNSVVITPGRLHHFAFTFDGASAAWEVDGLPVAGTWDNPVPTSLYAGASDFVIADYDDATGAPFSGTLSQLVVHKDPTTVWSTATKAAIRAAGKPSEIQAIVDNLGGTAWYFPYGDGSYEALQSLPALTHNGASEQRIIPAGAAGIQPTHGPGVLAPGQSLDLACDESNAPVSINLLTSLADGTYNFGDGNENSIVFVQGDANQEQVVVCQPAATGDRRAFLESWSG